MEDESLPWTYSSLSSSSPDFPHLYLHLFSQVLGVGVGPLEREQCLSSASLWCLLRLAQGVSLGEFPEVSFQVFQSEYLLACQEMCPSTVPWYIKGDDKGEGCGTKAGLEVGGCGLWNITWGERRNSHQSPALVAMLASPASYTHSLFRLVVGGGGVSEKKNRVLGRAWNITINSSGAKSLESRLAVKRLAGYCCWDRVAVEDWFWWCWKQGISIRETTRF